MNTATMTPDGIRLLVANKCPIERTVAEYREYTYTSGLDASPATFAHKLKVLAFLCRQSFKIIEMERSVRSVESTEKALEIVTEISCETEGMLQCL